MTNKLKNKRGFSLVELMVVVAIMGTLASIAIPAFNEYRKSAKKSSYRVDLSSLHKSWLAFGVELDSFCDRESGAQAADRVASIVNVGMESLNGSKLYGANPKKENFIGFGGIDCTTVPVITVASAQVKALSTTHDSDCKLDVDVYQMGVYGHLSGKDYFGISINNRGVLSAEFEDDTTPATADSNCT